MKREKIRKPRNRIRKNGINPQHFSAGQIKLLLYIIPIAVIMGLPILFIFVNAFKPMDELFAYPPRFFVRNPTLQNFQKLFALSGETNIPASRYLFNSVVSTALVVFGNLAVAVMTAYVFSKREFRGKKVFLTVNMLALMFLTVAVAIPRYFIIVYTGLQDSFFANVIPLIISPVNVFLVKQFIDQIPNALIEAAVIDGAGDFAILRKIIIPLSKSALATVAITSFQSAWGATEASTLYINNENLKTFSFYISTLTSSGGVATAGVSAAATLIMFLPNLIIFIFCQSRVMNTMAHSGIK